MDEQHLIFLSYASPDRERVLEYYEYLSAKGFHLWIDKRRIKGGQNWDFEIKKALQKAEIIIVFLSLNSVDRRGYARREIKIALDRSHDKLIGDIYIIPVMLDAGIPIPSELDRIQAVRPEDGDPMQATAEAIEIQLEKLGAATARIQGESDIRWALTSYKDSWDGLPGYENEYQLPRFHSELHPQINELTDVIRGYLLVRVMAARSVKFDQDPNSYNFGQDRFFRQNSFEASCGDPKIKGRVVTVSYSIWSHNAGAAHPIQGFKSFSFMFDPVVMIGDIQDIFRDEGAAFLVIQATVRELLLAQRFNDMVEGEEPLMLDEETVKDGTKTWEDFSNFVFEEDGISILFGSYQVAAYAFGPQIVCVPYKIVAGLIKDNYAFALGIK